MPVLVALNYVQLCPQQYHNTSFSTSTMWAIAVCPGFSLTNNNEFHQENLKPSWFSVQSVQSRAITAVSGAALKPSSKMACSLGACKLKCFISSRKQLMFHGKIRSLLALMEVIENWRDGHECQQRSEFDFHTLANREDERTSMSSLCWLLLIFLMILKKLAIESLDNDGKFLCEVRSFLLEYQGEMLNHVHKALCMGLFGKFGKIGSPKKSHSFFPRNHTHSSQNTF